MPLRRPASSPAARHAALPPRHPSCRSAARHAAPPPGMCFPASSSQQPQSQPLPVTPSPTGGLPLHPSRRLLPFLTRTSDCEILCGPNKTASCGRGAGQACPRLGGQGLAGIPRPTCMHAIMELNVLCQCRRWAHRWPSASPAPQMVAGGRGGRLELPQAAVQGGGPRWPPCPACTPCSAAGRVCVCVGGGGAGRSAGARVRLPPLQSPHCGPGA
jgi:hypothetical protein